MDIFNFFGSLLGYIFFYLWEFTNNYGIAIILITFVLILISFPSSLKQHKSMIRSTKFAKKQAEIRKMYAKNPSKQQEEMMKLNEREGINPMGGCLTSILPLIFFSGLFCMLSYPLSNVFHFDGNKINQAIEVLKNSADLEAFFNTRYQQLDVVRTAAQFPDQFTMFTSGELELIKLFNSSTKFIGLDLLCSPRVNPGVLWIIPTLSGLTGIVQGVISMKMGSSTQQLNKGCSVAQLVLIPLLFAWFTIPAPAALGIYYITSNLLRCIQSVIMYKMYNPRKVSALQEAARIALRVEQEKNIK